MVASRVSILHQIPGLREHVEGIGWKNEKSNQTFATLMVHHQQWFDAFVQARLDKEGIQVGEKSMKDLRRDVHGKLMKVLSDPPGRFKLFVILAHSRRDASLNVLVKKRRQLRGKLQPRPLR